MTRYIYDTEVFRYDNFFIAKEYGADSWAIIHNDAEALVSFLKEHDDDIFIGFNSKSYDQYIVKAIAGGLSTEDVKDLSDFIVKGGQAWENPLLDDIRFRFNNVDIRDDMQQGLSLKAIEAHLGMDIEETEVDFNLDRPLTDEEVRQTIHYCKHDVEATEQIVKLREGYLSSKIQVGKMAGIEPEKAMSMTNAKLTAALLRAVKHTYDDERRYSYPGNLRREYVPKEVFDFFDRMYDESLTDEEVFRSKLNLSVGGTPAVIAYGGIHAAIPNFEWQEDSKVPVTIRNFDVASYYPSLMIKNRYVSRSIPSAQIFEDIYHQRIAAKKAGDKATANALKLVLNTTYGATLNRYNDLNDPLMARSVCISGQLYLTELAFHLLKEIPGLQIVQLNTDGIMFRYDLKNDKAVHAITDEWQSRTGFGLEEDVIQAIWQKDVNNYVMLSDGHEKAKGGYLVRGIAPAGAFNINNNAVIVAEAIRAYFVSGTPAADTINACDDILKFQLIAKAGAKYRDAYVEYAGKRYPVQKVNRVYASNDPQAGRLSKIKLADDSEALIASMPDHCAIDNRNVMSIKDIDKQWYILQAEKKINDFKGIKPGKKDKMADKKPLNALGRLLEARLRFLGQHVEKSGKHMKMQYKYFELDDIVPVATPIFHDVGLLAVPVIDENNAVLNIINIDDPSDVVMFSLPFVKWDGNQGVNPIQAMGASVTYYRRYLYMLALDVCEPDSIDANNSLQQEKDEVKPAAVKPAEIKPAAVAPAKTPKQMEAIKPAEAPKSAEPPKPAEAPRPAAVKPAEKLTSGDTKASDEQIANLKAVLKKLRDTKKPEAMMFVNRVAVETKKFTDITRARCEAVMLEAGEMLK